MPSKFLVTPQRSNITEELGKACNFFTPEGTLKNSALFAITNASTSWKSSLASHLGIGTLSSSCEMFSSQILSTHVECKLFNLSSTSIPSESRTSLVFGLPLKASPEIQLIGVDFSLKAF